MTALGYAAIYLAYAGLEYWLGKTDKVKAGSVLEVVANGVGFFMSAVKGKI